MKKPEHMIFVALTGGVASGKSSVASMFQEEGALWLHADRIAMEILDTDSARKEIVAAFGEDILNGMGTVQREKLAAIVFEDEEKLATLEAIIHPRVQERSTEILQQARPTAAQPVVAILDVPLLEKSMFRDCCDVHIFIDTDFDTRNERAQRDRGWSGGEVRRRENKQKTTQQKKQEADYTINNSTSILKTKMQVVTIWKHIHNNYKEAEQMHDQE